MNILGLSEFFKDSFLVCLEHFLLVFNHLPVLVVMVAEDVVDLFDGESAIYPFDVL